MLLVVVRPSVAVAVASDDDAAAAIAIEGDATCRVPVPTTAKLAAAKGDKGDMARRAALACAVWVPR